MEEKPVKSTPAKNNEPTPTGASAATTASASSTSTTKTNGLAIAALVLSFFVPFIALILGIVALSSIKKNGENGKGLAIAAIVLSSIFMLIAILFTSLVLYNLQKAAKDNGVNVNNGGVTIQGKDGNSASIGSNAQIPNGFPSDVPIYKPSDVVASSKSNGSYGVSLLTSDSLQKVSDYYSSELPKQGWQSSEDTGQLNLSGGSVMTFTKGSQTLGVILASDNKSGSKTSITLTVSNTN